MRELSLPTLLGYDPLLLRRLATAHQRQLGRVAEAWLLSCVLLASPLGYAAWLVEHSVWLSALASLGTFLLVLNMLRLITAGAGAAPHFSRAELASYRPTLASTVLVGMLALLFAQPAQLPLWSQSLAQPIAEHRQIMIEEHQRSRAALSVEAHPSTLASPRARFDPPRERELAGQDHYGSELSRCEFLVLRLTWIWRQPGRALRLTGVYLLLVLLPALGARMFALDSLRAYELLRWQQSRRTVVREAHANTRQVESLLSSFESYTRGKPHWADPPFNTQVVSPLLLPDTRSIERAKPARSPWFSGKGAA